MTTESTEEKALSYLPTTISVAVKKAMADLLYIPFEFENGGTRVIHYAPEEYFPVS